MSDKLPEHSALYKTVMHFVGGVFGGMTGVAASYPLDTVKVRMQTQAMTGTYYKGMGDCVSTVWKTEGLNAFYRGIAAPMSSYGIIKSITFGSYGNCLDAFKKSRVANGTWTGEHSMSELFTAGCVGGAACTVVMAPNDRIKVQMQLSASEGRPFKGVVDCGKYIIQTNGVIGDKGLFRGWTATAMRDIPGMSGYYVAYEAIKKAWAPWGANGKHTDLQNLTAGGLSGQLSWLPVYPMDVIKSRIQARAGSENAYKGIGDAAKKMLAKEGIFVFYKGFAPTLIQAFPLHGSVFMVYELWCRATGLKE
mmetsp:Transcript_341/g.681  ORF Transcript_341/g.681 Transcript_341/m.681 type:complete len:307 (+) Transcript_341:113-1033(+)